ncbi:MAG: regulatory protein RecX [Candidatus Omnitrophota bacterium]
MPDERIKEYAFLLLKYRLRSEKELYFRLKRKKFPEVQIERVLNFLKEKKFLDDTAFTKAWIRSRVGSSFGFNRISRELKLKGVSKDTLEKEIGEAKKNYSEEEVIEGLARAKLDKFKGIDLLKARNRIYAYLIRRGFTSEKVINILNQICKQTN